MCSLSENVGRARVIDEDGFVVQYDDWTSWTVARPFSDVAGAREYLLRKTECLRQALSMLNRNGTVPPPHAEPAGPGWRVRNH
jgi:hypothetical protein